MMSPSTTFVPAAPSTTKGSRSNTLWPLAIVSLLGLNATIVGVTVYFAVSDKSVATEPNYYAKALNYNEAIQQRATNERLGWRAEPTLGPSSDGRSVQLAVKLLDRDGKPIPGASVRAVAFASARSGTRESILLSAQPGGDYAGPININRSGLWYITTTATLDAQTFTSQAQLIVPNLPSKRK